MLHLVFISDVQIVFDVEAQLIFLAVISSDPVISGKMHINAFYMKFQKVNMDISVECFMYWNRKLFS